MKKRLPAIAAAASLLVPSAAMAAEKAQDKKGEKAPAKAPEKAPAKPEKAPESIGSATMKEDGTIVMMLRATGGGAVGDAMLTYPKSHPEYANILKHLGGLKPGETKPVPPFP
ncbi:MAG TPA: hypothetical protein VGK67_32105 [Myxococcales bacterium]|jgi:hypothetical protein